MSCEVSAISPSPLCGKNFLKARDTAPNKPIDISIIKQCQNDIIKQKSTPHQNEQTNMRYQCVYENGKMQKNFSDDMKSKDEDKQLTTAETSNANGPSLTIDNYKERVNELNERMKTARMKSKIDTRREMNPKPIEISKKKDQDVRMKSTRPKHLHINLDKVCKF